MRTCVCRPLLQRGGSCDAATPSHCPPPTPTRPREVSAVRLPFQQDRLYPHISLGGGWGEEQLGEGVSLLLFLEETLDERKYFSYMSARVLIPHKVVNYLSPSKTLSSVRRTCLNLSFAHGLSLLSLAPRPGREGRRGRRGGSKKEGCWKNLRRAILCRSPR